MKEQARLSAIQSEVLKGPSDVPGGKALHATQRIARALEQLWVHSNRQQHFGRLLAAAQRSGLQKVQLPQRVLQAGLFSSPRYQHWFLHGHRASWCRLPTCLILTMEQKTLPYAKGRRPFQGLIARFSMAGSSSRKHCTPICEQGST